jgi:hypothetical protein
VIRNGLAEPRNCADYRSRGAKEVEEVIYPRFEATEDGKLAPRAERREQRRDQHRKKNHSKRDHWNTSGAMWRACSISRVSFDLNLIYLATPAGFRLAGWFAGP